MNNKIQGYILVTLLIFLSPNIYSQSPGSENSYRYSINLLNIQNNQIVVNLLTPRIKTNTAIFAFPKIIPGTYRISDYGKFISDLKAFDGAGKQLVVSRMNDNQWEIKNAKQTRKISYTVRDIFNSDIPNAIFPMAATDIENKVVVVNPFGFFGFIEGMTRLPFTLSFTRKPEFYASTSLIPSKGKGNMDVFNVKNVDDLYDAPILYSVPDTATLKIGKTDVLISVYSPNHKLHASQIAGWLHDYLFATAHFLGGELPANRYAFLYYFRDPVVKQNFPLGLGGALEHNTSSFYYLYEVPQHLNKEAITDVSSHEFFHIITPLNIASKEIREFNWDTAVMSKHLWLYEGVTEYSAHHVQVMTGLNTVPVFLQKMTDKITRSKTGFNDSLSFTELSKHSADLDSNEYTNVYQKGALIAASLDLYLLHLSGTKMDLRKLMDELRKKYGKERYFNDDSLFDIITRMTYPEVRGFFSKYVEGGQPIPYDYFFGLAGVKYTPARVINGFGIGRVGITADENNHLVIIDTSGMNPFGKTFGYHLGDVIYSFNGVEINAANFQETRKEIGDTIKEGSPIELKIGRKNAAGMMDSVILKTAYMPMPVPVAAKLELIPDPSPEQLAVRNAWLILGK
ncbi:MAG TPA: peptidase M61 [Puia sp.]|nr:peptidase M61 [Puia sp.]